MKKQHIQTCLILFAISVITTACFSPNPSSNQNKLVNIYEGPVTAFNNSCSECHGENGSDYDESFSAITDKDLAAKIHKMFAGPARIVGPQDEEILAMIEYHRALRDKKIFIMINNAASFVSGHATALKGNVTPGAELELHKIDSKKNEPAIVKIVEKNGEWILQDSIKPPFTLIARKDGQQASLSFPERQWN